MRVRKRLQDRGTGALTLITLTWHSAKNVEIVNLIMQAQWIFNNCQRLVSIVCVSGREGCQAEQKEFLFWSSSHLTIITTSFSIVSYRSVWQLLLSSPVFHSQCSGRVCQRGMSHECTWSDIRSKQTETKRERDRKREWVSSRSRCTDVYSATYYILYFICVQHSLLETSPWDRAREEKTGVKYTVRIFILTYWNNHTSSPSTQPLLSHAKVY